VNGLGHEPPSFTGARWGGSKASFALLRQNRIKINWEHSPRKKKSVLSQIREYPSPLLQEPKKHLLDKGKSLGFVCCRSQKKGKRSQSDKSLGVVEKELERERL